MVSQKFRSQRSQPLNRNLKDVACSEGLCDTRNFLRKESSHPQLKSCDFRNSSYDNFRKFVLGSGKEIVAGRDSEQNDLLVENSKRNDVLLHTAQPGSPFVNLGEKPEKEEIDEGAIFCALKSQDWRDNQGNVKVNVFMKKDCFKDRDMKSGSWSVKKTSDTIKVNKIDVLRLQHDVDNNLIS